MVAVFPDNAAGNFTHCPEFGKWLWATFNEHQWDLNRANPQVLLEITRIMLHPGEGWARAQGVLRMHDALSDSAVAAPGATFALPPYARVWLT